MPKIFLPDMLLEFFTKSENIIGITIYGITAVQT